MDIWISFGLALTLIFQWFTSVMNSSQLVAKPRRVRFVRFVVWPTGIAASAYTVVYGLMNEPFGSPNPLYPWMRITIFLAYLAVWGYIIKRHSTLPTSKIPK
jgi:hypothetical protein